MYRIIVMLCCALALSVTAQVKQKKQATAKPTTQGQSKGASMETPEGKTPYAIVETNVGTFEIKLYPDDAPKTVKNFIGLTEEGYFNNVIFHRISKGFVIQTGDPSGTGTGGKSIYGGDFEDELNPKTPSYQRGYKKGVTAMANRGPNTNTSQFFIMLTDVDYMPKNYSIFGAVTKGLDIIDKIGSVEIRPQMGPRDGRPVKDVVMQKVTIEYR